MKINRELALRLLESARALGADAAEVYLRTSKNLTVEVKGQTVDALESSVDFAYALRVMKDLRLGFSYSTDPGAVESVAANAVEASRWTEPDECLDLPDPSPASPVEIFDAAVDSIERKDAIAKAHAIERSALDCDRRITKVRKSSASFSTRDVLIVNSKGVDALYSTTAATAQIMVVAEDGHDSQVGWEFDGSRFLDEVSFEEVGRNAAGRALRMLGARKIDSMKAPVILDQSVAVEFLGIFSSLLSSESVQKGKSLLAKRLNERVVSGIVTLTDDGGIPHKLGSRPCDDEGVATSRKELIKDGVLLGFMYNSHTARKDGVRSTGNAVKGGIASLPTVGPLNLCLTVASDHVHSGGLFGSVERAFYVTEAMGMHTANPISGEFSIGVSGLWVEEGEVRFPVKEAVISANILDFFSRVEAAGDDLKYYGNMASPSLLIGPTDISA